jgi:hypothetical protein
MKARWEGCCLLGGYPHPVPPRRMSIERASKYFLRFLASIAVRFQVRPLDGLPYLPPVWPDAGGYVAG